MVMHKPFPSGRGGNRHPLPVKKFILDYLARVGQSSTTDMRRSYKEKMDELARAAGRKEPYRKASWNSFNQKVWDLVREGLIEAMDTPEESPEAPFASRDETPTRRVFRLKR